MTMKVIRPMPIHPAELLDSNVLEDLPYATSAVDYDEWANGTAYNADDVICKEFTIDASSGFTGFGGFGAFGSFTGQFRWLTSLFGNPSIGINGLPRTPGTYFGVFKALKANVGAEPAKFTYETGGNVPGGYAWQCTRFLPIYDGAIDYQKDFLLGHITGGVGAIFQSLLAANGGFPPYSNPSKWRQSTAGSYATWSGATTYATGDRVVIFIGSVGTVYESLQNSNLNNNPATATSWWSFVGQGYATWDSAATYAEGDIVVSLETHREYESLQAGNSGHDPTLVANSIYWLDRGSNNKWRMFDGSTSSQTVNGESIDVTLQTTGFIDSVCLMNCDASQVQIIAMDGVTERYNETYDLTDPAGIDDWHAYFTEPISNKTDFAVTDIPAYADMTIQVIVTNNGGQVAVGALVIGKSLELGGVHYGLRASINDFSKKEQNEFGDWAVVKRKYSKTAVMRVTIDKDDVDTIVAQLATLRAEALVWFGSPLYLCSLVYGYYKNYEMEISYPNTSYLSLEVESLT